MVALIWSFLKGKPLTLVKVNLKLKELRKVQDDFPLEIKTLKQSLGSFLRAD